MLDKCDVCRKPVKTYICKYCEPLLYLERFPNRRMYLSPRQKDVMALLADGWMPESICRRLNITAKTLENHIAEAKNRM